MGPPIPPSPEEQLISFVRFEPFVAEEGGFAIAGSGIIEDCEGDAYRAVYTVKFATVVYVLHCFQKKSKRGARTPQPDVAMIKARLRAADADYRARKETR